MKRLLLKFLSLPGLLTGIIAITGLCAFMIYSGIKGEDIYQDRLMRIAHPEETGDETICLGFIKINEINGLNARAIDRRMNTYHLFSDDSMKIKKGETYSITGQITSSGKIKILVAQTHRHRKLKYIFSSLSFILVIFLIIKYFRIDKKGIYLVTTINRVAINNQKSLKE